MIRCTQCNSPMTEDGTFGETEPEWICEVCGGRDGETVEILITTDMEDDYVG